MQLFLVRHGETDSNRQGLALGRADVPLNDLGRRQAARLAERLSHEPLAAVYSSPLRRALETAEAIAAPHGLPVVVEPGLIEMDVGEIDQLTFAEVRERFPGLLEAWLSERGPWEPMPGGERLIDVQERALKTLRELCERHLADRAVCVVSHNFLILCILADVLGIEPAAFRRIRQAVAGISVIEVRPDRMRLLTLNDTCHLAGAG